MVLCSNPSWQLITQLFDLSWQFLKGIIFESEDVEILADGYCFTQRHTANGVSVCQSVCPGCSSEKQVCDPVWLYCSSTASDLSLHISCHVVFSVWLTSHVTVYAMETLAFKSSRAFHCDWCNTAAATEPVRHSTWQCHTAFNQRVRTTTRDYAWCRRLRHSLSRMTYFAASFTIFSCEMFSTETIASLDQAMQNLKVQGDFKYR